MHLVVFGLTLSSSWGNGHATLWRGLCRALRREGHRVTFFERDVPWYADHRDLEDPAWAELVLYPDWKEAEARVDRALAQADAAIVTSYCPDAVVAGRRICRTPGLRARVFYDLDSPVTLERLAAGQAVEYVGEEGLSEYDLVLSYAGGRALEGLERKLRARRVAPLYGCVDPDLHRPAGGSSHYSGDLSYLGTYAADRQDALESLFLEPARRLPRQRFVVGGAQYPVDFPWTPNTYFVGHVAPADHAGFFGSCRLTLNVTRGAMAATGFAPSGRLFEAAACGVPVITDRWDGIEQFFEPGREILVADGPDDVVRALTGDPAALVRMGEAARARTLVSHSARHRALELIALLQSVATTSEAEPALGV